MGEARLAIRAQLRTNRRALLGLVVLGVVGFGVALGCLAGARRTDTVFQRFVEDSRPGDLEVSFPDDIPLPERLRLVDEVLALPQIDESATAAWVFHTTADGARDGVVPLVPFDESYLRTIDIPRVVEGRLPDPDREDELILNTVAAERLDLGVGDALELVPVPLDQADRFFSLEPIDAEPRTFTVTGIGLTPADLEAGAGDVYAVLSPAYWDAYGGELAMFGPSIGVQTRPGQRADFIAAVSEILSPSAVTGVDVLSGVTVADATRIQAVALAVFGGIVGITTLVFVALAFGRYAQLGQDRAVILAALGMTRRERTAVLAAPSLGASAGIAVGSAVLAVALSRWFPLGLAGRAEPDRGLDLDPLVVVGGGLALALLLAAVAVLVTRMAGRRRRTRPVAATRRLPVPLVPALGLALATGERQGRRGAPLGTVLVTAVIGVTLVVATVTFGRSLVRLTEEPDRFGWAVDLITGTSDDPDTFEQNAPGIEGDARIGDWAVASSRELAAGDQTFWVLGLESVVGDVEPVIIDGRAPGAPGEVALGRQTLSDLDTAVGEQVDLRAVDGGTPVPVTVVGITVLPGGDHDFPGSLGEGGVMTRAGLAEIDDVPRNVYLVRAAEGTEPEDLVAGYQAEGPGFYGAAPGPDIDNLEGASAVIPALTVVIALLAVAALAHGFVVTVRRRRPDLAVLSAMGLRPRQVRRLVLSQGAVVAVVALVVGVPLGLVLAHVAWGPVARDLGVADDLDIVGPLVLLAVVAAVVIVALAVALPPAVLAGRTRPAVALRTE